MMNISCHIFSVSLGKCGSADPGRFLEWPGQGGMYRASDLSPQKPLPQISLPHVQQDRHAVPEISTPWLGPQHHSSIFGGSFVM